ncbi:hypothetical protein MAP00_008400 [Monascus purpureus]|nr:hypothetical protein MAP00_008400 [Monascus purpureus]
MAENVPPASASAPNAQNTNTNTATTTTGPTDPNASNRGLPYYEKLRRELRDTLQKKRLMDKSMAQLEDQIYRFEQSYLEETTAGNIIKGFDNYIKGSTGTSAFGGGAGSAGSLSLAGGSASARRKAQVVETDRVFSRSSASFMRDSPTPSSSQTPSLAPTPSSTYGGNGNHSVKNTSSKNNKKKSGGGNNNKNDNDGDESDKPPVKRLKITYGRD